MLAGPLEDLVAEERGEGKTNFSSLMAQRAVSHNTLAAMAPGALAFEGSMGARPGTGPTGGQD